MMIRVILRINQHVLEGKIWKNQRKKKDKRKKPIKKDDKRRSNKGRKPKIDEIKLIDIPAWTIEEDNIIAKTINEFGQNWDLITDILNSQPFPTTRRRIKKYVMEHWKTIHSTFEISLVKPNTTIEFPILEVIKRHLGKKGKSNTFIGITSTSSIELITPPPSHQSHIQAAISVGIDSKPKTPLEVMQRNMSLTPKISTSKDSPDLNKLGYKLDTKLSSLGLMRGPLYNVGGPMTSGASGLSLPKGPVSLKSVGEQSRGTPSFPRSLKPPVNITNKGEGKTVILNSNGAQTRRLETINQTIQGNTTRSNNSDFNSKWNIITKKILKINFVNPSI